MTEHITFIQDLAILLLASMLAGVFCKRVGLSPVAGYLLAGIGLGTGIGNLSLLQNQQTIQTLAQLGMVFLMFSIGLEFSLKRLRKLGISVLLTTFLSSAIIFAIVNLTAGMLGFPQSQRIFLGAMLMICSSAIVSKILESTGIGNEKSARTAMGMALCEDIVAVVILTLLSSYTRIGGASDGGNLAETLGLLLGFVLLLIVFGLVLIPAVLRWLMKFGSPELETLFVAGILFGLAVLAEKLGYSMALGAFLIGAVFAETKRNKQIERAFSGLKDVFSAIFFAAVGLLIDVQKVPEVWPMIVGVSGLALVARCAGASTSLVIFGTPPEQALRSGLIILPLGEFSFIIASMGVSAKLIPDTFNTVAVGAALLTSLLSPVIVRKRTFIVNALMKVPTPVLSDLLNLYHRFLAGLQRHQHGNKLWNALRPLLVQIAVEFVLISTLIVFSKEFAGFVGKLARALKIEHVLTVSFISWACVFALALPFTYVLWRNISTACDLCVASFEQITHVGKRTSRVIGSFLKGFTVSASTLWFWSLIPHDPQRWYADLIFACVLLSIIFLLRRRFVQWYGDVRTNLESRLSDSPTEYSALETGAQGLGAQWNLAVQEFVLPNATIHAGKTLIDLHLRGQFGCSIASVERHGFIIENPPPNLALYPEDKLLLMGAPESLAKAKTFLSQETASIDNASIGDLGLETFVIPDQSAIVGKTLRELTLPKRLGIQVVGISKQGKQQLNPNADTILDAGDQTVLLGTNEQLTAFHKWVIDSMRR